MPTPKKKQSAKPLRERKGGGERKCNGELEESHTGTLIMYAGKFNQTR
jgi:hypothetical protein